MATTSKEINIDQLSEELGSKGLVFNLTDPKNKIILPAENSDLTEEEIKSAIDAHIALPPAEPTIAQKLSSVGLNIDDLKSALGL
jgi:hypothetical protein